LRSRPSPGARISATISGAVDESLCRPRVCVGPGRLPNARGHPPLWVVVHVAKELDLHWFGEWKRFAVPSVWYSAPNAYAPTHGSKNSRNRRPCSSPPGRSGDRRTIRYSSRTCSANHASPRAGKFARPRAGVGIGDRGVIKGTVGGEIIRIPRPERGVKLPKAASYRRYRCDAERCGTRCREPRRACGNRSSRERSSSSNRRVRR